MNDIVVRFSRLRQANKQELHSGQLTPICQHYYCITHTACKHGFRQHLPRLFFVGYAQTIPGVFSPGIALQRTLVSSVERSYPYPEVLEVLYDIHTYPYPEVVKVLYASATNTRGVRVSYFYTVCM